MVQFTTVGYGGPVSLPKTMGDDIYFYKHDYTSMLYSILIGNIVFQVLSAKMTSFIAAIMEGHTLDSYKHEKKEQLEHYYLIHNSLVT